MADDDSTLPSDKFAAYRVRQAQRGLTQATEWIPSERRALFSAVAKALRNGEAATIEAALVTGNPGPVASDPGPVASDPGPVASDPGPAPVASDQGPVASDPGPTGAEVRAQQAKAQKDQKEAKRQAALAAEWQASTRRLHVIDTKLHLHEARVTRKVRRDSGPCFEGVILKDGRYMRLVYEERPEISIPDMNYFCPAFFYIVQPHGWVAKPDLDAEIKRQREVVSELHPDNGGPGGAEFVAAKAKLDALRGRK